MPKKIPQADDPATWATKTIAYNLILDPEVRAFIEVAHNELSVPRRNIGNALMRFAFLKLETKADLLPFLIAKGAAVPTSPNSNP